MLYKKHFNKISQIYMNADCVFRIIDLRVDLNPSTKS